MTLSFQQLSTPIPEDEALEDLRTLLADLGFSSTSWQSGSVQLTMLRMGARIYSKLSEYAATVAKGMHNDTATGEMLTRYSLSAYANTRFAAISAQHRVTLTVAPGEGPHTINLGSVVVQSASAQTFRNVAGLSVTYPLTVTSAAPSTVLFEAEVAGAAGNVASGTITTLVTTLAGVTVTNADPAPYRTGIDEETDPALQTRNRTKWPTLSVQKVRDGVVNKVLSASSAIAKVAVNDQNPRGAGTFDVYIAAASSVSAPADVSAAQAAINEVTFGNAPSLGAGVERGKAFAASAVVINLAGTIYYSSSSDGVAVKAAVDAALLQFVKDTPLGGWDYSPGPANVVRLNDLESVIKGVTVSGSHPVRTVTLTSPSADYSVGAFQVVTLGTLPTTYTPVT